MSVVRVHVYNSDCCDQQAVRQVIHYLAAEMKKKGIDLNITDQYQYTPLHFAAMRGNEAVTSALLELGAHVGVSHCACV